MAGAVGEGEAEDAGSEAAGVAGPVGAGLPNDAGPIVGATTPAQAVTRKAASATRKGNGRGTRRPARARITAGA